MVQPVVHSQSHEAMQQEKIKGFSVPCGKLVRDWKGLGDIADSEVVGGYVWGKHVYQELQKHTTASVLCCVTSSLVRPRNMKIIMARVVASQAFQTRTGSQTCMSKHMSKEHELLYLLYWERDSYIHPTL